MLSFLDLLQALPLTNIFNQPNQLKHPKKGAFFILNQNIGYDLTVFLCLLFVSKDTVR